MELVDLTDKWQYGKFYEVTAYNQCDGCVFWPDEKKDGVACWTALGCEGENRKIPRTIYINTDEASVIAYVQGRLDGPTKK
jgi:hypothetical protein